jgi:hypothetical protein
VDSGGLRYGGLSE